MKKTIQIVSKRLCLAFTALLIAVTSWGAQDVTITGKVTDTDGESMPGVTVIVVGTSIGTVTDISGEYTIGVPANAQDLQFSFIGMKTSVLPINGKTVINATLEGETIGVDEVVVVGYGTQKKVTVTGAVSSVNSEELAASPAASVANSLAGKITGVTTIQYSGQPGSDAAQIYIRGVGSLSTSNSSPLVMVDGVERDFTQLDPEEIEDISVLKDASATAVYGIRGANGVILVTTKRGDKGKPKISASTSYGIQQPAKLPVFADSYTYATVYNNAQRSDGMAEADLAFPEHVVEAFRTNSDPIMYPNVNWMEYMVRDYAPQSKSNISLSGGTDRLKYFASFGYLDQEGMLKEFDTGSGENYSYKRYNYRANVDIDVTKTTELNFSLGGQSKVRNEPAKGDINQMWRFLYRYSVPWASAGIVDGKYIIDNGESISAKGGSDPLSQYYGGGFDTRVTNVMNFDIVLRQDLSAIAKGLKFRIKGAYNVNSMQRKVRSTSPDVYTVYYLRDFDETLPEDDLTKVYPQTSRGGNLGYSESYGKDRSWYMETALTYNRKFGNHEVGGLLLYNQRRNYYPSSFSYLPTGYVGSAARLTYNYKTRYMAEVNLGYNGSENFAEDQRYGLFPAVSLGWVASEESFIKSIPFINYMKIRGSYGMVGSDRQGSNRFLYLPDSYANGGAYNFGVDVPSKQPGYIESKLGNPEVTWETAYKQNYGVDLKVLNNQLSVNFDYFISDRKNILTTRQTVPGFVAATLPAVNIGEVHNEGYEINVKWEQKIKDFKYWINPNMSHTRNRIVYMDEIPQKWDYLYRTGGLVGQPFGFNCIGFYSEADFDADGNLLAGLPVPSAAVKPGDAIYLDTNEDGVINNEDQQAVGYPEYPLFTYGLNTGFRFKNFDFRMTWVAATHTSRVLAEVLKDPFGDTSNQSLLQYLVDNSWTPETAETATMPRITFTNRLHNRFQPSDMWTVDASYIRLKNLELGYNFKGNVVKTLGASSIRVYANGYNLFTFDRLDDMVDPEAKMNSRPTHPAMKVYNVGVKVNF